MTTPEWPPALRERPVCPKRGLPAPYIAEVGQDGQVHFTILDHKAAMRCLERRLCAMCGGPMGSEVALIGDVVSLEPDGMFIEPPVHEDCALIACGGLCPYLSRERVPRRPVEDGVAPVGITPAELSAVGRPGKPKRPVIVAIATGYHAGWVPSVTGSPVMAYRPDRGAIVRVRRFAYVADRLTEIVPEPPRPPVRLIRQQPKRRPRSKR